jgi:hypothetical protein
MRLFDLFEGMNRNDLTDDLAFFIDPIEEIGQLMLVVVITHYILIIK